MRLNAKLTDADLEKIAALPDLRAVKLSKQPITDAGLQKLLLLTKLKSLGLDETQITDAGLAALEKLPALEELLLANTQIGDAGIEHLLRLPKLKRLRLSGTKVTDAGAARLATLKTLEDLDLSKTAIGNEGLAALGQLPKLVKLNLWTTRVTDGGLESLESLRGLKWLNLDNTAVSDAGLREAPRLGQPRVPAPRPHANRRCRSAALDRPDQAARIACHPHPRDGGRREAAATIAAEVQDSVQGEGLKSGLSAMTIPRLILVGGFLGAGKTTLLAQAAVRLSKQGKRVGLVANDQAADLVDSEVLRITGTCVEEVAGGCFCCRFPDMIAALERLAQRDQADVLLGEPVGSCTDLAATVMQPLKTAPRRAVQPGPAVGAGRRQPGPRAGPIACGSGAGHAASGSPTMCSISTRSSSKRPTSSCSTRPIAWRPANWRN